MADSPIQNYPDVSTSSNTKVFALNPGDEIGWVDYPEDAVTETYVDGAISDHNTDALAHGGVEGRMDTAETNITNNAAAIDGVDDAVDQRAPGVGGTTGQVWGKVSNTDYDAAWIDQTDGGGGDVTSVNGETGNVVLDADDIDDAGTTNKFATDGQLAAVDALGTASTQDAEDFATAAQGDLADSALQAVSVPDDIDATGTADSATFLRGDGAWATPAGGGDVDSVNSQTGTVVLDPDDLDDTSTTNKFATAAQLAAINQNADDIEALGPFVYDEVGDLPGGTPVGTVFFVRNAEVVPPGGEPPSVRDVAFNLYSSGNPLSADLPDYEEGDMLLAICKTQGDNNDQLTATGWTPAAWGDEQSYADTRYLQILTRTATASETDPISLDHGTSGSRVITAVMSIQNAGSIDAFSIFTVGAGDADAPIAPSVTALSDDSLALVFAGGVTGSPNVATTTAASNGFAEELNVTSPDSPSGVSNDGLSIYSKDVDTGAVGACEVTFTGPAMVESGAGMIVIGPAA